jgi:predicted RNase H-like HicB family nuclease
MNIRGYNVEVQELSTDLGGGFIAFAPELKGCVSDGESRTVALLNLEDAIASWLEAARVTGRPIPERSIADRYSPP